MHVNHTIRKRFGQNFLIDESVILKIILATQSTQEDYFVEIGPGAGVLTSLLLSTGAELTAIEIDRDLVALLQEKFSHNEQI